MSLKRNYRLVTPSGIVLADSREEEPFGSIKLPKSVRISNEKKDDTKWKTVASGCFQSSSRRKGKQSRGDVRDIVFTPADPLNKENSPTTNINIAYTVSPPQKRNDRRRVDPIAWTPPISATELSLIAPSPPLSIEKRKKKEKEKEKKPLNKSKTQKLLRKSLSANTILSPRSLFASKKKSVKKDDQIFGVSFSDLVNRGLCDHKGVPFFFSDAIEHVSVRYEELKESEVVLLLSKESKEKLKEKFSKPLWYEELKHSNANVSLVLLKLFLQEQPVPLLTYNNMDTLLASVDIDNPCKSDLMLIGGMLRCIPAQNRNVLKPLIGLLNSLIHRALVDFNAQVFGKLFGPALLWKDKTNHLINLQQLNTQLRKIEVLAEVLVQNSHEIFDEELSVSSSVEEIVDQTQMQYDLFLCQDMKNEPSAVSNPDTIEDEIVEVKNPIYQSPLKISSLKKRNRPDIQEVFVEEKAPVNPCDESFEAIPLSPLKRQRCEDTSPFAEEKKEPDHTVVKNPLYQLGTSKKQKEIQCWYYWNQSSRSCLKLDQFLNNSHLTILNKRKVEELTIDKALEYCKSAKMIIFSKRGSTPVFVDTLSSQPSDNELKKMVTNSKGIRTPFLVYKELVLIGFHKQLWAYMLKDLHRLSQRF